MNFVNKEKPMNESQIRDRIIWIRNQKVMLDRDLAALYGVTTRRLNEQVKRNLRRFPIDFMFQLTSLEKSELVANCDRLVSMRHNASNPYAFTEHGAVMLASILNSDQAIQANIMIVRAFTSMRDLAFKHKDMLSKIEKLEQHINVHDEEIQLIIKTLKTLIVTPPPKRNKIGFIQ
jgi:hypothetical protein